MEEQKEKYKDKIATIIIKIRRCRIHIYLRRVSSLLILDLFP